MHGETVKLTKKNCLILFKEETNNILRTKGSFYGAELRHFGK